MSSVKKVNADPDNLINARIQRKFDLVFQGSDLKKPKEDTRTGSVSTLMDDSNSFGEFEMSSSSAKNEATEMPQIDLDFTIEDELGGDVPAVPQAKNSVTEQPVSAAKENTDGLDFSLDFDSVEETVPEKFSAPAETPAKTAGTSSGLSLASFEMPEESSDGIDLENFQSEFAEDTKKTIVVNSSTFSNVDLESFKLENTGSHSTADLMSTEEAKANIESTIKDILRPKNMGGTQEIDLSQVNKTEISESYDFTKTPSNSFSLEELMQQNDDLNTKVVSSQSSQAQNAATGEFFIDSSDFTVSPEEKTTIDVTSFSAAPVQQNAVKEVSASLHTTPVYETRAERLNDEDSLRFHATLRQLREEREELLGQIKHLKSEQKELEQDNLSLKAGLDEAKIEITILRKRHMVELEDLKYRLSLSEEKKAMAEEKARQAELRRDKLEQKVRIDYNQVKLREKELESKLEMLSMDIDSQVQGRDQKILELRRKIDALEFNMENASIKEQRSHEDKRKLEDKLNKIMKTLRNSIKNLEEDIDLVQDEVPTTDKN